MSRNEIDKLYSILSNSIIEEEDILTQNIYDEVLMHSDQQQHDMDIMDTSISEEDESMFYARFEVKVANT